MNKIMGIKSNKFQYKIVKMEGESSIFAGSYVNMVLKQHQNNPCYSIGHKEG